jgi:hypothetical protein
MTPGQPIGRAETLLLRAGPESIGPLSKKAMSMENRDL